MNTLILRLFCPALPQDHTTAWAWMLLEQRKSAPSLVRAQGQGMLADLPAAAVVELILPAQLVTFLRVRLPAGHPARLLQALPYLVEEHLMSPPEQVHVVLAAHDGAHATVATLDKSLLRTLLTQLASQGIYPQRALPATLLLPLPARGWSVAVEDRDCFVRLEACYGLALEMPQNGLPPVSLRLALDAARQAGHGDLPPDLMWIFTSASANTPDHAHADTMAASPIVPSVWQEALGIPCKHAADTANLDHSTLGNDPDWRSTPAPNQFNLLQGEFAPRQTDSVLLRNSKKWGVFLLLILLLHLGLSGIWLLYKQHQITLLQQEMTGLFLRTFGQNNVVVDAALQMQRKYQAELAAQGLPAHGDFIVMLAAASQHLPASLIAEVRGLQYQAGHLQLVLPQQSPEADLQQAMLGLRKQGWLVNIKHDAQAETDNKTNAKPETDAKPMVILDIATEPSQP